jgi:NADH-quinone oxidoreductase subunit C
VQRVLVDRGEITYFVRREYLLTLVQALRDDEALRFELCSSVSGVDYLDSGGPVATPDRPRLHAVYHLTSMTYRRRIRLEVAVTAEDPHVPSVTGVYPTADWHEREAWDMMGIRIEGHPNLRRILLEDDWEGHPLRKDYPIGGEPVRFSEAE